MFIKDIRWNRLKHTKWPGINVKMEVKLSILTECFPIQKKNLILIDSVPILCLKDLPPSLS